ncbi:MAG: hypothetical protein UY09_C0028G0008 [Parcubacteria group bacterium GW2011_GWA2_47_8]|nr:MAG: hypothetical protein UY09_C0028G0008 [Parcubacteria group bacterium GW2011_GWA2_47_8]
MNNETHKHRIDRISAWAHAWKWTAIALLVVLVSTQVFGWNIQLMARGQYMAMTYRDRQLVEFVVPRAGAIIPVKWGDLGKQLVDAGVIDIAKFEELYASRGGIPDEQRALLTGVIWAFGLGNKNGILEEGLMVTASSGDASGFASTGGWPVATGNVMDHYSAHPFVTLTVDQQELVARVAAGTYRPCCDNPTHFPDCNHGMAILGLLELMAAQGASEDEMYRAALWVNSYWFPDTYLTLAKYFAERGVAWEDVDPKTVLSSVYSSASGYQQVLAEIRPVQYNQGGSCGI